MVGRNKRIATLAVKGLGQCTKCEEIMDLFEFRRCSRKSNGRSAQCKSCEYSGRDQSGDSKRRAQAKHRYGLSLEEYDRLLSQPCGICGQPSEHLDHCHESGKVRGGLCRYCNQGLGFFKDDTRLMYRAVDWIESHQ